MAAFSELVAIPGLAEESPAAQTPPAAAGAEAPANADAALSDDADAAGLQELDEQSLVRFSLQFAVDSAVDEQIVAADRELARGDVLTAVSRWRELLERRDAAPLLATTPEGFASVHDAVARRLAESPPDVRAAFERVVRPAAEALLQRALALDDVDLLQAVMEQSPHTPFAWRAGEELAARRFDAADFSGCSTLCSELLASAADRAEVIARAPLLVWLWAAARDRAGDSAGAGRIWRTYGSLTTGRLPGALTDEARALIEAWSAADAGVDPSRAPNSGSAAHAPAPQLPGDVELWRQTSPPDENARNAAGVAAAAFETLAHPLLRVQAPYVADGMVVHATGRGIACTDLQTGQPRWRYDSPSTQRSAAWSESARRLLGESLLSRFTVSGDAVFVVEDVVHSPPRETPVRGPDPEAEIPDPRNGRPGPRAPHERRRIELQQQGFEGEAPSSSPVVERSVVALDLESGDVRWTSAAAPDWTDSQPIAGSVLGLPAVHEGSLLVLVQHDELVQLDIRDSSSGALQWSLALGDAPLQRALDPRRQWQPAVVSVFEGCAYCSTGAGALASVDLSRRVLRWVVREPRRDWLNAGSPQGAISPEAPRMRTWVGFRDTLLAAGDSGVFWAAPETDALLAIDAASGRVRWRRSRGDLLLAAPLPGESLLLQAPTRTERVAMATGDVLWTADHPPVAGTGCTAAGWRLLPLRSGGALALDVATGSLVRSVDWEREVLGGARERRPLADYWSVAACLQGVLIEDAESLRLVAPAAAPAPDGVSIERARRLARLGNIADSASVLLSEWSARPPDQQSALRTPLQSLLSLAIADPILAPDDFDRFETALRGLEQSPADSADRLLRWLDVPPPRRDPVSLAEALCEWSEASLPDRWWTSDDGRRVRWDAAAVGMLIDAASPAPDDGLAQFPRGLSLARLSAEIEQGLDDRLARWDAEGDSAAAERLLASLWSTTWGARRQLERLEDQAREETSSAFAPNRISDRLQLHILSRSHDADIALRARRLEGALFGADFPASGAPGAAAPADIWPAPHPQLSIRPWKSMLSTRPARFDVPGDGELAGLNLELDRSGQAMRFSGLGERRPWTLRLPSSNRSLRSSLEFLRGWGVGPLVVFQTGVEVFGVVPRDPRNGGRARLVWPASGASVDAWDGVPNAFVGLAPQPPDVPGGLSAFRRDEFRRPLAAVGPVSPDYFCVRQFGKLTVWETASGQRRWDLDGFAADAVAAGDESAVVIFRPDGRCCEVRRPLDGRAIGAMSVDWGSDDLLGWIGRCAVVFEAAPHPGEVDVPESPAAAAIKQGPRLALVDPLHGGERWSRRCPPGAAAVICSDDLLAIVADGQVQFVDVAAGSDLARHDLELPGSGSPWTAAARHDEFGLQLLATGPPARTQLAHPTHFDGGPRRPFADGWLFGFDSSGEKLLWRRPLMESVFPIDQPRDVPVLLIDDFEPPGDVPANFPMRRLNCIDKRTGALLHTASLSGAGMFVVERDPLRSLLEIRTGSEIIRLDYSLPAAVDAPPTETGK